MGGGGSDNVDKVLLYFIRAVLAFLDTYLVVFNLFLSKTKETNKKYLRKCLTKNIIKGNNIWLYS